MKLRLWPRRRPVEPDEAQPAPDPVAPAAPESERVTPGSERVTAESEPATHESERATPATRPARKPASAFARPYAPSGAETAPELATRQPATLSLTLEEARTAIRAAGGDVIQIGFLARAYRRQLEEEPESKETAAARKRLSELVAKRLKDRHLLEPDGRFELTEEPPPPQDKA